MIYLFIIPCIQILEKKKKLSSFKISIKLMSIII